MSAASVSPTDAQFTSLARVAIIPVRADAMRERAEVALVRNVFGAWSLMEEWAVNGSDDLDAARRCALEKGGFTGSIDPVPIGAYLTWAPGGSGAKACIVNVFVMRISPLGGADVALCENGTSPAACEWFSVPEAMRLVGAERGASLIGMAAALAGAKTAA